MGNEINSKPQLANTIMNPQFPNLGPIILLQLIFGVGFFAIGVVGTYMFYARLRDIADELRKFRIAYEMAEDRTNAKAKG